jgi:glycosyltransferase involved in cell wall biosynthesis
MVGYVPWLKRLDRALDVLELVRARDDRYRMVVKGRGPWEYPWMSAREEERSRYVETFDRLKTSPVLREAVVFEPFGEDVADYLQQIGWVLSMSEVEGHSLALAEGMASGAIPVVLDRPGARRQYEPRWVHDDPGAAAAAVLDTAAKGDVPAESRAAADFAERWDWKTIEASWDDLLGLPGG